MARRTHFCRFIQTMTQGAFCWKSETSPQRRCTFLTAQVHLLRWMFSWRALCRRGFFWIGRTFLGVQSRACQLRARGTTGGSELRNRRFREIGRDPLFGRSLEDQLSTSILTMLPIVHATEDCLLLDTAPLATLDTGGSLQTKIGGGQTIALHPARSFRGFNGFRGSC